MDYDLYGDAGGITEQVGYATADNITGPYTAYAGNPVSGLGLRVI